MSPGSGTSSPSPTLTITPSSTTNPASTPASLTQQVTDMTGRVVTVPNNITRIIAIKAGCLRMLTYMDARSLICAVEQTETTPDGRPYSLANPEYATLSIIGPAHGGDPELIASQNPDVVFVTYTTADNLNALQSQLGVPVIGLLYGGLDSAESRQTLYEGFNLIGQVLHKEARATELINYINGLVDDLNTRTSNIADVDKPTVYIGGLSASGSHGFTSTSLTYSPFVLTNAKNVLSHLELNSTSVVNIDLEAVPGLNPEIIFIDYNGLTLAREDVQNHLDVFNQLDAIDNGKVYGVLGYNWYTTNFDTSLVDAYYVGSVLYPSQFSDIDPVQKANEIYTFMCGTPVYEQMVALYGPFGQVTIN